jgi:hypothetical protein
MSKKNKGNGKGRDTPGKQKPANQEKPASGTVSKTTFHVQKTRDGWLSRFFRRSNNQDVIVPESPQIFARFDKLSAGISLLVTKEELTGVRSKVEGFADEFRAAMDRLAKVQEILRLVAKAAEETVEKANLNARIKELEERNSKLGEECRKAEEELLEKSLKDIDAFYPDSALCIFGLKRKDVADGTDKARIAALRLWCNFAEWSENGEAKGFVNEFRKIDRAVLGLKDSPAIKEIRDRIGSAVRDIISQNIKAGMSVSWDFVEQIIDSAKHFSAGGGQRIVFVKSALIARDGAVLEKAEVECE